MVKRANALKTRTNLPVASWMFKAALTSMVWYRERPIRHSHRVRQASSRCLKAPDVSKLRPCATRTPPLTLPADWAAPGHGQHSQQSLGLVQRPLRGRSVRVHARRPRDQPGRATQAATLDRVRAALRTRHYSRRTEEAYVAWIRRYILFHRKRHPAEMGAAAITRFLSSPAVDGKVAASTQNEALSALLFLYRDVWSWTCPGWTGSYGRSARNDCQWS